MSEPCLKPADTDDPPPLGYFRREYDEGLVVMTCPRDRTMRLTVTQAAGTGRHWLPAGATLLAHAPVVIEGFCDRIAEEAPA